MLYHLEVGSVNNVPTGEDLEDIVKEFNKPMPAFTVPVKIHEIYYEFGYLSQRLILNMGCKGWEPTGEERDAIRLLFEDAIKTPDKSEVVATRFGVKVLVINDFLLPEVATIELSYQDRVVIERDELGTRFDALTKFLATDMFSSLDEKNQSLLKLQHIAMSDLLRILNERIKLF